MAAPKKATSAKKTTAKKPVAKKAPAKRAATKVSTKTSAKRAKASEQALRSFRRSPSAEPFFTIRINHQTLYWLILAAVVIGLAIWVLSISMKVQSIYDQIDVQERETQSLDIAPKR